MIVVFLTLLSVFLQPCKQHGNAWIIPALGDMEFSGGCTHSLDFSETRHLDARFSALSRLAVRHHFLFLFSATCTHYDRLGAGAEVILCKFSCNAVSKLTISHIPGRSTQLSRSLQLSVCHNSLAEPSLTTINHIPGR